MKKRLFSVLALAVFLLTASLVTDTVSVMGSGVAASDTQEAGISKGGYRVVKFKNVDTAVKSKKIKTKDYEYSIIKKSGGGVYATYYGTARNYISVSSKGGVTVKKKTPKKTYKIDIFVATGGGYKAAQKTIKIKVKA